jgi:hypothetical protein
MDYVTAQQASVMTGLSERTIRRMIERGTLKAKHANARRYTIAVEDLPPHKPLPNDELATRVAVLERAVQRLTQLVEALVGARTLPPVAQPSESPLSASGGHSRSPRLQETFSTHAAAARWLGEHGVNEYTPKTWVGWRSVPLEPRAILADALTRGDPTNHRKTVRLHQCGDPLCVCGELLSAD